jgi:hypothetical protein
MVARTDRRADRAFGSIRVTVADWPMLIAEFPEKRSLDEDVFAAFAYVEELMKDAALRRERVFFIADLTAVREITSSAPAQTAAADAR